MMREPEPLRILFVMLHFGYVRNYEGVLRQLAAQGHRIHIAAELARNKMGEDATGEALVRDFPQVSMGRAAVPEDGVWSRAAHIGRLLVDALRYLEPQYRTAEALRTRAIRTVPRRFRSFIAVVSSLGRWCGRLVTLVLGGFERAVPLSAEVTAFLKAQAPDVLLVTPLVEPGSIQVDYIKSARVLGIPTALCVASWDNLTNKGSVRVAPDRVFVWNEPQAREAVELHGVPRDSVVVTGAQIFDHWFSWRPSRTREEFCAAIGFDPARPIILYLGSSFFIAPNEAEFGLRWLTALRAAADPEVSEANILIRPHPSNAAQWSGLNLELWPRTAVWPPRRVLNAGFARSKFEGLDMFAPEFKNDFYDSLHFSAAVVGVNTSAQIEAAIMGRVVCTVASADFTHSQAGTLHFHHLVDGGLLEIARDFDSHIKHLSSVMRDVDGQAARARRFVESFVRPFGADEPATPRVASAIVQLGALRRAASAPDRAGIRAARAALYPIASFLATTERRPWWVYVLRPVLFVAIQAWALPYRLAAGVKQLPRVLERGRQAADRSWRRSVVEPARRGAKWTRSRSRYAVHRFRVNVRLVGARVARILTK
jgi:hypothetical protein